MKNPVIEAADLFCGAGGTSTGMLHAAKDLRLGLSLLAINHWPVAINTHSLNHKNVRHKCESLDSIRPIEVVPGGRLGLLAASPECTHHSIAAGGRPKNDQSRATAWHICRWASDLTIDAIFMENVKEWQDWGPLDSKGKPMKSRKGETFQAFIQSLRSMNYRVEYRVQNAAAFGDPTSRKRLLVMARRNGGQIVWPEHSHGQGLKPYRTAREVIDWDLPGKSIFNRKRPLSANTMRRIAAGLRKFGGANAEPFLVMLYGSNDVRSVDRPMPTVTAGGNPTITGAHRSELALIEPFVLGQQSCAAPRSVDDPVPTIASAGAIALVQPFVLKYYKTGIAKSLDLPLDTISTKDRFMLVEPVTGEPVAELDIRLRMLQPHELSAAMGFPDDYQFYGNREQQVKQIGNAVPVEMARAHTRALLKSIVV